MFKDVLVVGGLGSREGHCEDFLSHVSEYIPGTIEFKPFSWGYEHPAELGRAMRDLDKLTIGHSLALYAIARADRSASTLWSLGGVQRTNVWSLTTGAVKVGLDIADGGPPELDAKPPPGTDAARELRENPSTNIKGIVFGAFGFSTARYMSSRFRQGYTNDRLHRMSEDGYGFGFDRATQRAAHLGVNVLTLHGGHKAIIKRPRSLAEQMFADVPSVI